LKTPRTIIKINENDNNKINKFKTKEKFYSNDMNNDKITQQMLKE
jgi:hypothetical protein